ncbi:MAG: glycosyltransferase [Chloroflexota bacterium]
MRILITGQTFYQKNNGQAVFTVHLAEGLVQLGHEVMVIAPSESWRPYNQTHHGLTLQTVPTIPLKHNANITGFSGQLVEQAITQFQPDLVHIQDHYFLSRAVWQVARKYGLAMMGTNHFLPDNLTYNFRIPVRLSPPLHRLMWRDLLTMFNTLQAVTTPTETAANILRKQKITAPVQAISCGVDQARFRPRPDFDRRRFRRQYGLDPEKFLLLYVGRVDREKALDILIRAVATLGRDDLQLAIAGQGTHLANLQTLSRQLSPARPMIFTGYFPSHDLPFLLNSADIFVMPSRAELQSIATLEAMSSGLPVLAANARALPELVEDGVNGYLFEVDNIQDARQKLTMLVDDRRRWPAMAAASLAKARPHSLPNTIRRYDMLYQELQTQPEPVRRHLAAPPGFKELTRRGVKIAGKVKSQPLLKKLIAALLAS